MIDEKSLKKFLVKNLGAIWSCGFGESEVGGGSLMGGKLAGRKCVGVYILAERISIQILVHFSFGYCQWRQVAQG